MLLVDSLYINMGGAMGLLRYLVSSLQERNVDFFLLADSRCGDEFNSLPHTKSLPATLKERKKFYKQHGVEFTSVLCFGNVPPPIKMKIPVYTYFHNISLLKIPSDGRLQVRLKFFLKQRLIDYYGRNTDAWIVQTDNTASELKKHLFSGKKQVYVLPFYHIPQELKTISLIKSGRNDYALIGELSYPRGHGIILDVWKRLHEMGFDRTLHLTVSDRTERHIAYRQKIEELKGQGVKIINHGTVPFSEIINIYKQCKAIVYPSSNESLGLSIIEAIESGCDVIASDLPFTHAICLPSAVFDRSNVEQMCRVIIEYDNNPIPKSKLKIYNSINELLEIIK